MKNWHLLLLSSFAFAQPLLDIMAKTPEFFVIRRSEPLDLFVLLFFLLFTPGLVLILLRAVANLISKILGDVIFALELVFLIACIILPFSKQYFTLPGNYHLLLSIFVGIVFCVFYLRTRLLSSFLNFLSPALLIFPLVFLTQNSIRPLLSQALQGQIVGSGAQAKADIVMLIFDELPLSGLLDEKMEIDSARFPGFAELAQNSTWFRNATSVSSWTEHAVPIILSGRKPKSVKEVPSYQDYPKNIFTLLGASHRLNVYEQVTHLCPESLCNSNQRRDSFYERENSLIADVAVIYLHIILPEDMKSDLPNISFSWGEFANLKTQDRKFHSNSKGLLDKGDWANDQWLFETFLASIKKANKPSFNFLHITFPHVPYRYYASGKKYIKSLDSKNDKGYRKKWDQQEWPTIQHYQRFLLQLGEADRMLQQLLKQLKDLGIFDSTMIVVVADHGSSFMPLEFSRRVSQRNYVDVMSIPFLVKKPQQKTAEVVDRNVESIDVLSTVADLLGVATDSDIEGVSAFNTSIPERSEKMFFTLDGKSNEEFHFPAKIDLTHSVQRKYQIFGSSAAADWQFKIGDRQALLGTPIEDLKSIYNVQVKLESPENFENVDTSSDYLPGYISGTISDIDVATIPYRLAVAVNGVIQATTETIVNEKNELKFLAIVPENSFTNGKNKITVKIISQ